MLHKRLKTTIIVCANYIWPTNGIFTLTHLIQNPKFYCFPIHYEKTTLLARKTAVRRIWAETNRWEEERQMSNSETNFGCQRLPAGEQLAQWLSWGWKLCWIDIERFSVEDKNTDACLGWGCKLAGAKGNGFLLFTLVWNLLASQVLSAHPEYPTQS